MRAEERLRAEGRLVDGEAAPADILAQVRILQINKKVLNLIFLFKRKLLIRIWNRISCQVYVVCRDAD